MWYPTVTILLSMLCLAGVYGETGAKSETVDLDKRGGGRMNMLKNYDQHFGDKRGGGRFTLQDFDDGNTKRGGARIRFGSHDKRGGARFRDDIMETDEKRRYNNKVRYANSFSRLDKRLGARFFDDGFAGDAIKRPGGVGGSRYNSFDDRMKRPGGKAWGYSGNEKRQDASDEYEEDSDYRKKRARSGYPSWLRTG